MDQVSDHVLLRHRGERPLVLAHEVARNLHGGERLPVVLLSARLAFHAVAVGQAGKHLAGVAALVEPLAGYPALDGGLGEAHALEGHAEKQADAVQVTGAGSGALLQRHLEKMNGVGRIVPRERADPAVEVHAPVRKRHSPVKYSRPPGPARTKRKATNGDNLDVDRCLWIYSVQNHCHPV